MTLNREIPPVKTLFFSHHILFGSIYPHIYLSLFSNPLSTSYAKACGELSIIVFKDLFQGHGHFLQFLCIQMQRSWKSWYSILCVSPFLWCLWSLSWFSDYNHASQYTTLSGPMAFPRKGLHSVGHCIWGPGLKHSIILNDSHNFWSKHTTLFKSIQDPEEFLFMSFINR